MILIGLIALIIIVATPLVIMGYFYSELPDDLTDEERYPYIFLSIITILIYIKTSTPVIENVLTCMLNSLK